MARTIGSPNKIRFQEIHYWGENGTWHSCFRCAATGERMEHWRTTTYFTEKGRPKTNWWCYNCRSPLQHVLEREERKTLTDVLYRIGVDISRTTKIEITESMGKLGKTAPPLQDKRMQTIKIAQDPREEVLDHRMKKDQHKSSSYQGARNIEGEVIELKTNERIEEFSTLPGIEELIEEAMQHWPTEEELNEAIKILEKDENEPEIRKTTQEKEPDIGNISRETKKRTSKFFSRGKNREASFNRWPHQFISSVELAAAGFFYTGEGDRVTCFQCGVSIQHWREGDRAKQEHELWNPVCPIVRREKCGKTLMDGDLDECGCWEEGYKTRIRRESSQQNSSFYKNIRECEII